MAWETTKECPSEQGELEWEVARETTRKCRSGRWSLLAAACDALRRNEIGFLVLDILRVQLLLPVAKANGQLGPTVPA